MKSTGIPVERFFRAVESACPVSKQAVERLLRNRNYHVQAEEVAQVMLNSGCSRESIVKFMRELKVDDETIATVMRYISVTEVRQEMDFSRYKKRKNSSC